jgi:hypothetical protein
MQAKTRHGRDMLGTMVNQLQLAINHYSIPGVQPRPPLIYSIKGDAHGDDEMNMLMNSKVHLKMSSYRTLDFNASFFLFA